MYVPPKLWRSSHSIPTPPTLQDYRNRPMPHKHKWVIVMDSLSLLGPEGNHLLSTWNMLFSACLDFYSPVSLSFRGRSEQTQVLEVNSLWASRTLFLSLSPHTRCWFLHSSKMLWNPLPRNPMKVKKAHWKVQMRGANGLCSHIN